MKVNTFILLVLSLSGSWLHAVQDPVIANNQDRNPVVRPTNQEVQQMVNNRVMRRVTELNLKIDDHDKRVPTDRTKSFLNATTQSWDSFSPPELSFMWTAPDICYQPLYYQDVALERYGQTKNPHQQVIKSAAHFFVSTITLPAQVYLDHPKSCDTPLGNYRPGNVAPRTRQRFLYHR